MWLNAIALAVTKNAVEGSALEVVWLGYKVLIGDFVVNVIPNQCRELVSVLAWCWNANCTRPVEVEMRQLVADHLNSVRTKVQRRVVDHIVVDGSDSTLSHFLGDKEEIVHVSAGDLGIDNCAGVGVVFFAQVVEAEETLVDLFLFKVTSMLL